MHSPSIMIKAPNIMVNTLSITIKPKAGERGRQGGGTKYLGPGLVRGARNLGKTSGHGCYCQDGWRPWRQDGMCNHFLVLGPDSGSRQIEAPNIRVNAPSMMIEAPNIIIEAPSIIMAEPNIMV